jgi:hypothetical protein
MRLDVSVDQLTSLGVHGDGARAVDGAIGYDGLVVDAGERLGGLVGEDGGFGGHCGGWLRGWGS